MRRVAVIAVAVVLAMVTSSASATCPRTTKRFAYVGNDFYVVGPDYAGFVVSAVAPVGVAPMGNLQVVPEQDHLTVMIRDAAFRTGTTSVIVRQPVDGGTRWTGRALCVPVGRPTVVSGLTPGAKAWFTVDALTFPHGCDHGATAGVLTISGSFTG